MRKTIEQNIKGELITRAAQRASGRREPQPRGGTGGGWAPAEDERSHAAVAGPDCLKAQFNCSAENGSIKSQIINILDVAGHMFSVMIVQLLL